MIPIIFFLNLLTESLRKKLTDTFPVILSTPKREEEYFLLMEQIFDFVIRQALNESRTSARIEFYATKTFDSFLELLKFGYFEVPSAMSYNTLYKKTDLIVTSFFDRLISFNTQQSQGMFFSPYYFGDYNRFSMKSCLSAETLRMYDEETYGDPVTFKIEQDSQCVGFLFEDIGFFQIAFPEEFALFNLDEADFPDGYCFDTERELFSEEIESIDIEDKIERFRTKPFSSKKRKLRNSIVFA
jgi:hypothetical protein